MLAPKITKTRQGRPCDTQFMTCAMWNVTCDIWQVKCDKWRVVNIFSKCQLPRSYRWEETVVFIPEVQKIKRTLYLLTQHTISRFMVYIFLLSLCISLKTCYFLVLICLQLCQVSGARCHVTCHKHIYIYMHIWEDSPDGYLTKKMGIFAHLYVHIVDYSTTFEVFYWFYPNL